MLSPPNRARPDTPGSQKVYPASDLHGWLSARAGVNRVRAYDRDAVPSCARERRFRVAVHQARFLLAEMRHEIEQSIAIDILRWSR